MVRRLDNGQVFAAVLLSGLPRLCTVHPWFAAKQTVEVAPTTIFSFCLQSRRRATIENHTINSDRRNKPGIARPVVQKKTLATTTATTTPPPPTTTTNNNGWVKLHL